MAAESIIGFAVARAVREDPRQVQIQIDRLSKRVAGLNVEYVSLQVQLAQKDYDMPELKISRTEAITFLALCRMEADLEVRILTLREKLAAKGA
jgi:hypothetical protein